MSSDVAHISPMIKMAKAGCIMQLYLLEHRQFACTYACPSRTCTAAFLTFEQPHYLCFHYADERNIVISTSNRL